ncbi:MAG: hypothetical protein CL613_04675 [Aquimarina sp.]|nr:hypothetical protein [Aquimarina sp.]
MKIFLQKLVKENVYLSLKDGELSVKIPKTGVDPALIGEIKAKKQELIDYLSNLNDPGQGEISPISEQKEYPLSLTQKRIWNLSRLPKGSIAYNIPGTIEIGADFDKDSFLEAVDAVINRHESLRTVFRYNESGEVRQYILSKEELNFEIEYFDYSQLEDNEEKAGCYINEDAYLPFDLESGPLFRAVLFKIKEDRYVFYYNMHGIAADGESIEIFTREAMIFSEAFKNNVYKPLQDLKIQYKDFAHWQSERLENNKLKEHKEYWSNQLSGELPILDLPNQKERPKIKTFSGKLLGTNLTLDTTDKLKKFVSRSGGNLFMGLVTMWKVFLYKYTAQQDLIIGTPALGRDHSDLEGQIGPYINTIALRNKIDPNQSFVEFYNQVKDTVTKSYSFQMYPYERIVEDIKYPTNSGRNPIFDTVLVLQREEQILEEFKSSGIEKGTILELGIGKKYVDTIVAKYDLEIDFRLLSGCLWFNINYNTDLYQKDTIVNLMISFRNLIDYVMENVTDSINTIPDLISLQVEKV